MAILGGATLTFGVLYGFLGARETRHRRVYLLFACFSLAYGVAILSARTAYLADTIDDHVASSRITAAAAALALACLLWYVRAFTSAGSSWFLVALTGALGVVGAVSLLAPGALFPADAGIEVVSLPWSEDVTTVTEDDALLLPLVVLVQILSIVYIVWANISLSLRGRTTDLPARCLWDCMWRCKHNCIGR